MSEWRTIQPLFKPYASTVVGFLIFVIVNRGIVLGKRILWFILARCSHLTTLGDRSNHIPAFHVPQVYYFLVAATAFGWPLLASSRLGGLGLANRVRKRMALDFWWVILAHSTLHLLTCLQVQATYCNSRPYGVVYNLSLHVSPFQPGHDEATNAWHHSIHHPFLLSDNRHYTFYIWKRVFMLHWTVPYLLAPVYLACGWAWFLRIGASTRTARVVQRT